LFFSLPGWQSTPDGHKNFEAWTLPKRASAEGFRPKNELARAFPPGVAVEILEPPLDGFAIRSHSPARRVPNQTAADRRQLSKKFHTNGVHVCFSVAASGRAAAATSFLQTARNAAEEKGRDLGHLDIVWRDPVLAGSF